MTSPRRIKAERGIYYRDVRRDAKPARVYEITYTDRFGKQRWETVRDGGIVAARALRGVRLTAGGPEPAPAKDTVAQVLEEFMAGKRALRPSSRANYEWAINRHIVPWRTSKTSRRLGDLPAGTITVDLLSDLVADLREGELSEWSVHAICRPLRGALKHALRRGVITINPWDQLTAEEKPRTENAVQMTILNRDAIDDLLGAAADYRLLFMVLTFTGLRHGELLALRWGSLDLKAGALSVTHQLDKHGRRVAVKTGRARRKVVLPAFLVKQLVEHRLQSRFSTEPEPVFATAGGAPLTRRKVYGAIRRARLAANVARTDAEKTSIPNLRPHDLRHTYASILIAQGEDVVFVSRALGHKNPSTTLDIYADLFDEARHADRARDRLDEAFGGQLGG